MITYKTDQSVVFYFFKLFFLSIAPMIVFSIILAISGATAPEQKILHETQNVFSWNFFYLVFLIPLIESCLLIYPTSLAGQAKGKYVAALIGALPIVIMHMFLALGKVVVLFSFYLQAFAYLELRSHNFKPLKCFIFVWLFHAANNCLIFTILNWTRSLD